MRGQGQAETIGLFRVGMRVTSYRRGNAIGVVKTEPFRDQGGDRRWWVWVDYTASTGAVALDQVRELRLV